MVRVNIKKGQDPSYSAENLKTALRSIHLGHYTIRSAAKRYHIPFSILQKLYEALVDQRAHLEIDPSHNLQLMNKTLVEVITTMEKWGWGLSRKYILELEEKCVKTSKIKTPFKNGEDWFLLLKKWHRLSLKPQGLEYARKSK